MLNRGPAVRAAGPVNGLHIGSSVDLMEHGSTVQKPAVTGTASHLPANVPALVEMAK